MHILSILSYSFKSILQQKLRAWLTIVGIILGVATIVSLVAIGDGISDEVNSQLEAFNPNTLIIVPFAGNIRNAAGMMRGSPSSGKLMDKDFNDLLNLPEIDDGIRFVMGQADISYKGKTYAGVIYGADKTIFELYDSYMKIEKGRYFEDNENSVVVLAYDAANEMFGKDKISIGNRIKINDKEYRVVGILEKSGMSMSSGSDSSIYLPLSEARNQLSDRLVKNEISVMQLEVKEGFDVDESLEVVENRLMYLHKVNEDTKDFLIISSDFIKNLINQIIGTITLFLFLISSISAVVGGIGISNTMFMNVLNKTREIGVLKSLGAKRNDILLIFIFEAILIGLVGGILGCGLGFIAVEVIKTYGITPVISVQLIISVLCFAVFIGILGGIIPAYRASKIPAIEALRY